MNAKKMFEKLGYKQNIDCIRVKYTNAHDEEIYFWLDDETLSAYGEYIEETKHLAKDELKAIVAQAKELGWLDE